MILSLAPLQGYTEFPFRNALQQTIGSVDKFYAPFIRLENDGSLKNKYLKDIHPDNNKGMHLVPQLLTNNAIDFLSLSRFIVDFGYKEVNWNLGCPFPMVVKRKLGSGLMPYPELIEEILETVLSKTSLKISIKIRSGSQEPDEIFAVLKQINHLPLTEIILHPRIGKQLYKGMANIESFKQAQKEANFNLAYNGDIMGLRSFHLLKEKIPDVNHFMIGRGLLSNPFLAQEIKNGNLIADSEKRKIFFDFHHQLITHFEKTLSGNSHLLNKLTSYWEYFSLLFENPKKILKPLKKCHNLNQYNELVYSMVKNEPFRTDQSI